MMVRAGRKAEGNGAFPGLLAPEISCILPSSGRAAVVTAPPKLLEHSPEQRFAPKAQDSSG